VLTACHTVRSIDGRRTISSYYIEYLAVNDLAMLEPLVYQSLADYAAISSIYPRVAFSLSSLHGQYLQSCLDDLRAIQAQVTPLSDTALDLDGSVSVPAPFLPRSEVGRKAIRRALIALALNYERFVALCSYGGREVRKREREREGEIWRDSYWKTLVHRLVLCSPSIPG
jgi:hypothetical protein